MHYLTYNIPLNKIKMCIITHSHTERLYPEKIQMCKAGFSHIYSKELPVFYVCKDGYNKYQKISSIQK